MLKPDRHLPHPSTMHSFRKLIHRRSYLSIPRSIAQSPNPHSSRELVRHQTKLINVSNPQSISDLRSLPSNHRRFSSGNRTWEDEFRSWTSFDPLSNPLAARDEESNRSSARIDDSEAESNRSSTRIDDSEAESTEPDEEPSASTFYSPTEAVVEDSTTERKPAQPKQLVERFKKSADDLGRGEGKGSVSFGQSSQTWTRRKSGKVKVSWVCESCGATPGQWWGACPSCQAPGSVKQFSEAEINRARGAEVSETVVRSWLRQQPGTQVPQSLVEVNKGMNHSEWRIPLSGHFGMEVARVLGGGLVPGSLVLVGGDPGVGKSTLLLQVAAMIAQGDSFKGPAPVIYVSGEESIEQIGSRADRMRIIAPELFLYSSTDVEDILDKIQLLSPQALIIDSIQTVYLRGVKGSAGNINQVKECTSALLRFAKQTNIPVLLIGHVTKSGDIAGPRILEHIVDAVLYMEGERSLSYRLLRSVKNRFGSTDELGVFKMSESGLQAVSNPSELFLSEHISDSEILAGLAVTVIVDGSRAFAIEIQALCVSGSIISRHVNGVKESRAGMIIAVLMKQASLKLQDNAIFINVVSGIKLTETAGDLAIAAAICSSFLEFPIPSDTVFIGEIGLAGELRSVPRMDKRVVAIAKLGYKKCVVPKTSEKMLAGLKLDIEVLGCRTLKEVINTVFS